MTLSMAPAAPNDQQRLVAGMMDKDNLLDLIRTFTLFSTNDKGQTIKIVGRYQQFRAVKLAVKRLMEGANPRGRSGIIWHTQGSGKSLTMMFMVREIYRHAPLAHWESGIRHRPDTTRRPVEPNQPEHRVYREDSHSIRKLKELLRADTSDLIMAMIHKFRETDLTETFRSLMIAPTFWL